MIHPRFTRPAALLALLLAPALCPAAPKRPVPKAVSHPLTPSPSHSLIRHAPVTHHYGVYMLGSRVGTSDVTESPATFEGKPALRVDAVTEMKLVILSAVEQKINLREYLDTAGRPLSLAMAMTSGGHSTKVDARFTEKQVDCVVDSGGTKTNRTVPIPAGVSLIADPEQIGPKASGKKLKPGVKLTLHMFEPMTLQIMPIEMEVLPSEPLTLGGKTYNATVVKSTNALSGESKSWMDEDGELLQEESVLGLKMVREDGATAPSATTAYVPPRDFAVATSIHTQTTIANPREVNYLKLRVTGIPEQRLVISDPRQTAEVAKDGAKLTVTYTIRTPGANGDEAEAASAARPASDPTPNAQHPTPYLAAAPYLEVDDPRIQKQARAIVGDTTDPLEKAKKIRAWVHAKMKPQMDIGIIRGATDVLTHPVGVCRDYAVLFTALARAAGLPARVCGGIVYFRDGFYYHAWSEVALPQSASAPPNTEHPTPNTNNLTWRAFDATLSTDFVDATHLKFAQGDPTAMFQAVRVVGQLKAEVLDYRPEPKS